MVAAKQRRRVSYFVALPLFVVIVSWLVTQLVAMQRTDMIAELADRISHQDGAEAAVAVRQLASMPGAPVSILVSAANSADPEVADEAKSSISRLLRGAQRQIDSGRRLRASARQLAALAEALAAQQGAFAPGDYPWLSSTTRKVLRLANRIPPRYTPLVAVHCDEILAGIAAHDVSKSEIADNELEVDEPFEREGAALEDRRQSRQARSERKLPSTPQVASGPREPTRTETVIQQATTPAPTPTVERTASRETPLREAGPAEGSSDVSADELLMAPWRAGWSHPVMRIMPAKPMHAPAEPGPPAVAPTTPALDAPPQPPESSEPPLAELDARELLRRWLDAEGGDVFPLEAELTRRGFGRLSERIVKPLFASSSEARLALIDNILTAPGVDARPWLVLLADDEYADVRLLAVTIMATSSDAVLVEKAWEVSIQDRDPRIAALVGRLRERRDQVRR